MATKLTKEEQKLKQKAVEAGRQDRARRHKKATRTINQMIVDGDIFIGNDGSFLFANEDAKEMFQQVSEISAQWEETQTVLPCLGCFASTHDCNGCHDMSGAEMTFESIVKISGGVVTRTVKSTYNIQNDINRAKNIEGIKYKHKPIQNECGITIAANRHAALLSLAKLAKEIQQNAK